MQNVPLLLLHKPVIEITLRIEIGLFSWLPPHVCEEISNRLICVKQKDIARRFDSTSRECRQFLFCGPPGQLRLRLFRLGSCEGVINRGAFKTSGVQAKCLNP